MNELALKIENVSKEYRLGTIGGGTLKAEIQSKVAKLRHKEDPNLKIGAKTYEKNERFLALDGINLEIKKGERIGIIGHNGAGKSTLLKLICRVTAPSAGNIYMNGRLTSMLEVGTGFHGELTGRENIYLNGAILGMNKAEINKKIEEIIDFSECRQFIDTPVKRYSSGMKVKLGFSVASHLDSEIMIMDEVLAVGDMAFQKKCIDRMRKVSEEQTRTILYVSHNMNTIRQLCDKVIVLDHGNIVYSGDPEKAIQIYLGTTQTSENHIDLSAVIRDNTLFGHDVKLTEINIDNKSGSEYHLGDIIHGYINFNCNKNMNDLLFRVIVRTPDGEAVTMFPSEKNYYCEKDKKYLIEFSADISKIVPGSYSLSFVLYEADRFGNNINLDVVRDVYCFEIKTKDGFNNNMKWEPRYWGYMLSNTIKTEISEATK